MSLVKYLGVSAIVLGAGFIAYRLFKSRPNPAVDAALPQVNQQLELAFRHLWANRDNDGLHVEYDPSWELNGTFAGAVDTNPALEDGQFAYAHGPQQEHILLIGCGGRNVVVWMDGRGAIAFCCPEVGELDCLAFVTTALDGASELIEDLNLRQAA